MIIIQLWYTYDDDTACVEQYIPNDMTSNGLPIYIIKLYRIKKVIQNKNHDPKLFINIPFFNNNN